MPDPILTDTAAVGGSVPFDSPAPSGSPATDFSVALLGAFLGLGVRDIVVSPGSRSQALALVAAELERLGLVRLHVRIDERGAGFLALGLAVETGVPALVICTSGTAVANLHPAVLEAHHSGVPLIVLTADRPVELRGIRSNQTTVQTGLFGVATRLCLDVPAPGAAADAAGSHAADPARSSDAVRAAELATQAMAAATGRSSLDPGPVQLNLAFREPLSAPLTLERSADTAAKAGEPSVSRGQTDDSPAFAVTGDVAALVLDAGPRTVVVAGTGAGSAAEDFARAGGWPLLAEVSSNARFGPNLVAAYRELLQAEDFGGRVERVIVFGHPSLSREIPALIQRDDVETIVVAPTGAEWYNPGHRVRTFARAARVGASATAAAETRDGRAWLGSWVMTSRRVLDAATDEADVPFGAHGMTRAEFAALRAPVTRSMLVDAVWRASWPHDRLVLGASRLIREADRRVPGKKISVHSNRGLAGIDGTIATATGIALASQAFQDGSEPRSTGMTRLLLGDLALLHDAGSMLLVPGEARARLQVIVGNDGGGTIFDGLEVAASAPQDQISRVLYTPHGVDLSALAAAYGWEYVRAATRSDLERALTAPPLGPSLLEVPLTR
ncbi:MULTISPECIES: 2-succinyl-5-enolpyruvyl-6-hydroxy-3-cyclohexene-1-carboxylic-acid synthase [unclassified Cryobacterium]|uniref:2-succinyl-5-enolpyruvyl-6-hydroxy-3- cyclohexene-1-carboxylic-acid synthase n=2 Tax=Cryobacterium TaxID=69578 RepID=UPI002AB37FC0|nr:MULTISPECIES: 2-succinyl-5-enolpyruvyl-6-hydroxy-3-cyclohexene-1-carboxylic-acid synthase [unclassified Cryobacterium]MDY7541856.1 2-succinyl-5-enolpyruvyl-6-hydroxy-3-cyclohexene-1-carboxylic-acid synthase [Cryobacterium sp. 5B3]MEB0000944.1 2-succinyl-5-enolpyruvyl-6-hydroxy-3-cyclohexene-1-carboxylic-acid synthase [Cryobacterium sp. RTS3]MEB0274214.1 2-succinyl-5-enolpyruvyl-6-hydroxy-3-cyclohexene-1-carboxylic-acid synthase [Cryobacterium sp. 5B3]